MTARRERAAEMEMQSPAIGNAAVLPLALSTLAHQALSNPYWPHIIPLMTRELMMPGSANPRLPSLQLWNDRLATQYLVFAISASSVISVTTSKSLVPLTYILHQVSYYHTRWNLCIIYYTLLLVYFN